MSKKKVWKQVFLLWFSIFCFVGVSSGMGDDLLDLPQLINLVDYEDSDAEVDVAGGFFGLAALNATMTDISFDPDKRLVCFSEGY